MIFKTVVVRGFPCCKCRFVHRDISTSDTQVRDDFKRAAELHVRTNASWVGCNGFSIPRTGQPLGLALS